MKMFAIALCICGLELAAGCCPLSEVSYPCYDGGFQLDGSWVYLKPTPTDGDLEYGTFLTLTDDPANLNALLLEVEPDYQSGYEVGLGYFFPKSNRSLQARYFSLNSSGRDGKGIDPLNQFIQNFLGASYSTAKSRSKHEIDQGALAYRVDGVIDRVLNVHLVLGAAVANIRRDFDVGYSDLVLNPIPSQLTGREKSRYRGVGPFGVRGQPQHGAQGGLEKEDGAYHRRDRVAGQADEGDRAEAAIHQRFARPHGDAPEIQGQALFGKCRLDEIMVADRGAAGGYE